MALFSTPLPELDDEVQGKALLLPVSIAFFGFLIVGLDGGAMGVLIPSMNAFYHTGDAVIGLLFLTSSFGYFLSALTSSLFTERMGLRGFLLLGAVAQFLSLLPFGLQFPFALLLLARLCMGFGVGIIETGLNVYITSLPRHTNLLTSLHAFYGSGALIGPLLASTLLAHQWQWSSVFWVMSMLSVFLIPGFALVFRSLQQKTLPQQQVATPTGTYTLRSTLKLPIVWIVTLFLLLYVGIEVSLGNWSYSFLLEVRHQGPVLAGWVVSGYWLGLTVGRFTLHPLAERLHIGTKQLMSLCILGVGAGLLLLWSVPFSLVATICFCFVGFCLAPIYPLTVAITPTLVPPRFAASAIGVLVSVSILGLAFFPWLAGIFAQAFGLWTLLPYMLAVLIALIIVWSILLSRSSSSQQQ